MKKTEIIFYETHLTVLCKKSRSYKIPYENIIGIFCERPYLRLQILNRKNMLILYSLEEMISNLPNSFILCNRSSIVNLLHVEAYTTDYNLQLTAGDIIPVSRRKKAEIREKINAILPFSILFDTVQHTF
jgi:DNA-binding LytR/AlgR family response regulator